MKIEQIAMAALQPYARNSRTHSPAQVETIVASIREFGFTNPVLIDSGGGIIAGHGRVLAAGLLKLKTVPCIRLAHLSEAQKRAYVIADNRIADGSGWDNAMLSLEIQSLVDLGYDLNATGLSGAEIDALLGEYVGDPEGATENHAAAEPSEPSADAPMPAAVPEKGAPAEKTNYPILIYLNREQYKAWHAHLAATPHRDGAQALTNLLNGAKTA